MNKLLMPNNSRGLSHNIWGTCPIEDFQSDCNQGIFFFDDFNCFNGTVAATVGTYNGGYKSQETAACSIKSYNSGTDIGGVVQFLTDNTDNSECYLAGNGDNGGVVAMSSTQLRRAWFECRVRVQQIVTQDIFIGLGQVGLAAADAIFSDADAAADKSWVGFHTLAAASATLIASHQKAGGGGVQTVVATANTWVANTWVKLGMYHNPYDTSYPLRYFVNNTEIGGITTLNTAKFPDGVMMVPVAGIKNSAAAISKLEMDWWAYGHELTQ